MNSAPPTDNRSILDRLSPYRGSLATGLSAAVLATGMYVGVDNYFTPDTCPAVSNSSLAAVEDIFSKPTDPLARPPVTLPVYDKKHFEDLSLDTEYTNRRFHFADYYAASKAVLAQAGVTLETSAPAYVSDGSRSPLPNELETTDAELNLLELTETIATVPTELIKGIHFDKVALVTGSGFLGKAYVTKNSFVLNVGEPYKESSAASAHELYHLVSYERCGSYDAMENDPAYFNLNKRASYLKEGQKITPEFLESQPISWEEARPRHYDLIIQERIAKQEGRLADAKTTHEKDTALVNSVEMATNYSFTSSKEDEADVGRNIFKPGEYAEMLNPASPVLRRKFLTLLAAMHQRFPKVVEYYASISGRPSPLS